MTASPDPVLENLRAATASPSWVQRGYTTERNHTNVLVAALRSGKKVEARSLAAALWNLALGGETPEGKVTGGQLTEVVVTPEYALKQGEHSTVDFLISLTVDGVARQLAVEVKVDGQPYSGQLASMKEALGDDPHRRLVLLCLGAAQASRIEPGEGTRPEIRRWYVADLLRLGELITAASPLQADAVAWLEELEREEHRRERAWTVDAELAGCGYRGRLLDVYRLWEVARLLESTGERWEVSLQRHGAVLHGKASHHEVPGTTTTLYLEVAGGTLRVKAGAWYDESNAREAAEPLVPRIRQKMEAHGFTVVESKRTPGSSVTMLSLDPEGAVWPRDVVVERLRRALVAWRSIAWPA